MRTPFSVLTQEAVRAAWSRPVWTALTVFAAVAVGALFATMIVADANAIAARNSRLEERGWGLVMVSASSGTALDARTCSAVASVPNVISAGGVESPVDAHALGLDAGLTITAVSPEIPAIVWPDSALPPAQRAIVTPGLNTLTGLDDGVLYVTQGGAPSSVDLSRIEGPGRYPPLDGSLLVVRSDATTVQYCLAAVAPEQVETIAQDIAAATSSFATIAVPVVSKADATPTPAMLVQEHRHRYLPLISATLLALVAAFRLLIARRDRAIYRLVAIARSDLWLMALYEYVLLLYVPWLSAFAATVAARQIFRDETLALAGYDLVLASAASLCVGCGFAFTAATGRNKHQFAPGV